MEAAETLPTDISNRPGVASAVARSSARRRCLAISFAGADCRLPCGGLLTWSRSNCLDLLLFGLLGFPIAPLLAFGHADFSLSFDNAVVEWQYLIDRHQAR